MKREVNLIWNQDLEFTGEIGQHTININADEEKGIRPKPLMLMALAGCTAMDVVSMLEKMRVPIEGLSVKVEGDMQDEVPKAFESMHIIYNFTGKDLPMDKLEKAVELSKEKYCGVSATLKNSIPITYKIQVHQP